MLSKKYRLSKKDFETAFRKKGGYFQVDFLKAKIISNNLGITRFGISCGTQISKKAVLRNKIKRRINESLRLGSEKIKTGYDVLIMPSPQIIEKTYQDIDQTIFVLLNKANLISVKK